MSLVLSYFVKHISDDDYRTIINANKNTFLSMNILFLDLFDALQSTNFMKIYLILFFLKQNEQREILEYCLYVNNLIYKCVLLFYVKVE